MRGSVTQSRDDHPYTSLPNRILYPSVAFCIRRRGIRLRDIQESNTIDHHHSIAAPIINNWVRMFYHPEYLRCQRIMSAI